MRYRFRFWVGRSVCGALALILTVGTTDAAERGFLGHCSDASNYQNCYQSPRHHPQPGIPGLGGLLIPIILNNLPPVQNPVPNTVSPVSNSDGVPRRKVPPKAPPRVARNDRHPPVYLPQPPATHGARAFPPPPGEIRFRRAEVLVELPASTVGPDIDRLLRRHAVTEVESFRIALLGTTLHLWRIPDSREVGAVVTEIGGEPIVASAQPNYVYTLQQDVSINGLPTAEPDALPYYAMAKLHVDEARALASGDKVLVAVLDTAIDDTHPDLSGVVEKRFDAILCTGWHREKSASVGCASTQLAQDGAIDRAHGTSIAGAIAARGHFPGVAPKVRLLQVRAFDAGQSGEQGSSWSIIRGADWASQNNASVINMSFAGPADPMLGRVLAAAFKKGVTLIASAGNEGRRAPAPAPFPAADKNVVAVTATDADDRLYDSANIGTYVAVAAPGVRVYLPTVHGGYAYETGTSFSAAFVSGVAALALQHRPPLTPDALRKLLTTTAKPLGGAGGTAEFGAGLVDAQRALSQELAGLDKSIELPRGIAPDKANFHRLPLP